MCLAGAHGGHVAQHIRGTGPLTPGSIRQCAVILSPCVEAQMGLDASKSKPWFAPMD